MDFNQIFNFSALSIGHHTFPPIPFLSEKCVPNYIFYLNIEVVPLAFIARLRSWQMPGIALLCAQSRSGKPVALQMLLDSNSCLIHLAWPRVRSDGRWNSTSGGPHIPHPRLQHITSTLCSMLSMRSLNIFNYFTALFV